MEKSASLTNLAKALIVLQSKVSKIKKDSKNPFFKSNYASLSGIQDEIQLPLSECGLCYTQHPESNNTLTTLLVHAETGEYLLSSYDMHPIKSDPQSLGSAITYAKRYALVAILGLNIDDDDDGNSASGSVTKEKAPEQTNNKLPELLPNTEQWAKATEYLGIKGGNVEEIKKKYQITPKNETELIKQSKLVTV